MGKLLEFFNPNGRARCDHPGCRALYVGVVERAAGPLYCTDHREWAEQLYHAQWFSSKDEAHD